MNDLEVLNEINKGALIGMESIKNISDKVEDEKLKQVIDDQYSEYQSISDQVKDKFESVKKLEGISTGMKLMNKTGIVFNTMMDNSTSKIAEILIQGNEMGIVKGRKMLNQSTDIDKETQGILNRFVDFQERNIESLKKYL
ncbi:MAG: hypothetical protein IKF52_05985 [Clostridia bacterium]|nr:hypothetical protein [Clostridia bacterium]